MPVYQFVVPTTGSETFQVKADSPEEAARILAESQDPNQYLIEKECEWDASQMNTWDSEPSEQLPNFIERVFEDDE